MVNPFEVTKAVDFTDDEIRVNFVPFSPVTDHESRPIADPASPMPRFLVGGKGGGRTHLMRYFSYPLQRSRGSSPFRQVVDDGYIGIYFRCSGLNGSRFSKKGQSDELWDDVFNYYMDVWLTEHLLNILYDIQSVDRAWSLFEQSRFATAAAANFGHKLSSVEQAGAPLRALLDWIVAKRRSMDNEINNVALRKSMNISIDAAPGRLIFEIAKSAAEQLSGLSKVKLTFLIDEFENLSLRQQMYINTLVREKELPTTFLVGGREWGIKTYETFSAGEINKIGSEFELTVLEDRYRSSNQQYLQFCVSLAQHRLGSAGYPSATLESLRNTFNGVSSDRLHDEYTLSLLSKMAPYDRPYLVSLREKILRGTQNPELAHKISSILSFASSPLVERAAVFRFYQRWSQDKKVSIEAAESSILFAKQLEDPNLSSEANNFLKLWKSDLLSKICRESGNSVPYLGFDQFVEMSGYLPRSFLTILKYITNWAQFYGESPFSVNQRISAKAQVSGVLDAARWFSVDALPLGVEGEDCDRAIRRLGTLLHRIRYSDKPNEVSCSTFSTNTQGLSDLAIKRLDQCVQHKLLIEIADGRSGRNLGSRHRKFQLHPMIAPAYGLSTARRGDLSMSSAELATIFDPNAPEADYQAAVRRRLIPLYAPFGQDEATEQDVLF